MQLEKPALFPQKRGFIVFVLLVLLLVCIRLVVRYEAYEEFITKPFYYTDVDVLQAYTKQKNGYSYQVLKLHSDEGYTFYTTTYQREAFEKYQLRIQIFPSATISFWDYLGTFYVKSRIKEKRKIPENIKSSLMAKVEHQHQHPTLQSFYHAIFFAIPLASELREVISRLGVSHLVALSGFHLGILWGVLFQMLRFLYSPLQQRFFPYRYALLDMGGVVIICLGVYVWFVDYPPSLLRAYAMVLVGWMVLLLGIELLSFTFLATIGVVLLALFPSLVVSIGFWLSMGGVFYIFLLLHYTKNWSLWVISLVVIPLGIFVLMLPIVHGIFPITTPYQLFSPFISLCFILFYPLAILAHMMGIGDVMDMLLLWLFSLPNIGVAYHQLPWWFVVGYVALSLYAIQERKAWFLLLAVAFGYALYLFG